MGGDKMKGLKDLLFLNLTYDIAMKHSKIWITENEMDIPTFLGYLAGFLTTSAFLPQVIKAWKTKSTQDLSLGM